MTKLLTVGSEEFNYPTTGTNPIEAWGDEATNWAEAITNVIGTIFAPGDITLSTVPLADGVVVATNVIGLKFSPTTILSFSVEYTIKRVVGGSTTTEHGFIYGSFNGVEFGITRTAQGDCGITLDAPPSGQFQYTSTALGHTSCVMRFKASTIAQ